MAPLEPWEKVLINEDFLSSTHGSQSCESCHGGNQAALKEDAHTGMIADPSGEPAKCNACHQDVADQSAMSLHSNLAGYWTVLDKRSDPSKKAQMEEMFGNHCSSCHTTCGDCHISQPDSVGGGLLSGHNIEKKPPMTRTCTACHGSRVGNEFLGKNEEIPGDVHFRTQRMTCTTCHTADNVHATPANEEPHRYAGEESPTCKTCHANVGGAEDANVQHKMHGDQLSCQVCHSVEYNNCDGCHVSISEKTGNPVRKTEATYLGFIIGKNPRQDENRPYEWVPLRHVPISPDSFAFYGDNLLPNFNSLPTWTYTTPHNIQRKTPQNDSCDSCHGNADLFLTADKVKPEELEANKPVIVDKIPPKK